ncbi:MAG: GNAT family N-acetyltransferase [Nitrospirae bacterium]|nr:GNAT family N-acetyltransferase [Nitrospirota bacterium]
MEIKLAKSDEEIAACFPVMHELRPHVANGDFVPRVRRQEASGYRLAYVLEGGEPVAVAGYRIGQNLAWGRFLYVDDLVTRSSHRSSGYGAALLSWLVDLAAKAGCEQVHLESGIQRTDAHRFYEREGMERASLHFRKVLTSRMDSSDGRIG